MKVVLVHGLLGSSLNWGPVLGRLRALPEFKGVFDFCAVDLLGHAYRPLPAGVSGLSLRLIADDLLAQVPDSEFVALGHSFGLRPLLDIVGRFPKRIPALIVEDSSPAMRIESFQFLKKVFDECPVPFPSREAARSFFDSEFGPGSALSRFLFSNIRATSTDPSSPGFGWRFNAPELRQVLLNLRHQDQWLEWENYKGLMCIIYGEKSDFQSAAMIEEGRSRRGNLPTQIYQVSQAGHWVHSENLDGFMDKLVEALNLIKQTLQLS